MCVLKKYCFLLSELSTARTVSVVAFAESAGGLDVVPIMDAMLAYDCEQISQVYLLVLQNVLHIESMDGNLTPPSILQETGIKVNEPAKIHCNPGTVTKEDQLFRIVKLDCLLLCKLEAYFLIF